MTSYLFTGGSIRIAVIASLVVWFAADVNAQSVPAEWRTTAWSGSTCASCHGNPVQVSVDGRTGLTSLANKLGTFLNDAEAFKTHMGSATIKGNASAMKNFAETATDAQFEAVRQYLHKIRDGEVIGSALAFAGTPIGNTVSASQSFTVRNYRYSSLSYTAAESSSVFSVQSPVGAVSCAGTAEASTSANECSLSVSIAFTPADTIAVSTDLNITASAANVGDVTQPLPRTFNLSGSGLRPIVLSSGNLSLGATVGSPTAGDVLVTNQSSSAISISGIDFSGTHASEFKRDDGSTCTVGGSIAATSNCTLRIRFDPTSAVPASRTAAVAITHSAFGSPQSITLQGNATAAPQGTLEIDASSLSFPDTQLGATAVLSMTLRNGGSAALAFTAFTIGGTHPSNFEREGNCSTATPLAIAAQCTLTLRFRPSDLGPRSGSIAIVHNGSNPSATISLSGKGIPVPVPVATFDPVPGLAFGAQTVGGLYPPRTLRLTNSGTAAMTVASVTIDGAAFSNANAAPCAATLAPAESCDIQVRYTAVAASTNATGTVRITTNAAGSPHVVPLSGNGTAAAVPVLEWASAVTPFDFGNVTVGTISPVQSVTLRNAGPGGVVLSLINTFGTDSSMFAAGSDAADASACRAGRALFEGNTCRIDVRFVPGGNGARSASLQVVSEGSTPPTLKLAGTGMSGPVSGIGLTPAALELETTRVDSLSAPVELSIQSSGAGVLEVQSMSMSGPFRMQNKTCPATPFTLAAGSACSVAVSFAPQAEGAASGTLTVVSDASPAGRVVALSARAEARPKDSGGGCTISDGRSPTDPTLWVLALLAAIALYLRRSHRAKRDDDGQ
jgi:trimeric autotransporter adhesin